MSKDRTDPHRPSALNPADYVFVGASDQAEYWGETSYVEVYHNTLRKYGIETGHNNRYSTEGVPFYDATEDGRPNYRCHHCGKHGSNIRYFIFFLHKPSGKVVVVGKICAKKLSLASKTELELEKRAAAWRVETARDRWLNDHPEAVLFLTEYIAQRENGGIFVEFFDSLNKHLSAYHRLTDKQLAALEQAMAKPQRWTRHMTVSDTFNDRNLPDGDRHKAVVTRTEDEPTEAQLAYLAKLAAKLNQEYDMPSTRIEASDLINAFKARLVEPMATENQLSFIDSLMEKRELTDEQRTNAQASLTLGLTKTQASAWIKRLLELPEIA